MNISKATLKVLIFIMFILCVIAIGFGLTISMNLVAGGLIGLSIDLLSLIILEKSN